MEAYTPRGLERKRAKNVSTLEPESAQLPTLRQKELAIKIQSERDDNRNMRVQ